MLFTVLADLRRQRHCPEPASKVHALEFTAILPLFLPFLDFGFDVGCLERANPIEIR